MYISLIENFQLECTINSIHVNNLKKIWYKYILCLYLEKLNKIMLWPY
jgi:hypothetical protein